MAADLCPQCGAPRIPGSRFCGTCAFDFWKAAESSPTTGPPSQPPPGEAATPTWNAQPPPAGPRNWRRIGLIVLGAVIVLAVIGYLAGGGDPVADTPTASDETPRPTPTATARPSARQTARPTATPLARADLVLADSGFTAFGAGDDYGSYAVIVENPNEEWVAQRVDIQVTFYDAAGVILGVENEFLFAILPGGRGALGRTAFDAGTATRMEVNIQQPGEANWIKVEPASTGGYTFENVNTSRDEFGGHTTTGVIRSSFEADQENVEVVAVYRNSAGAIVGGDFTFVDLVPGEGQSTFEVNTFVTFGDLAQTEMYADLGF